MKKLGRMNLSGMIENFITLKEDEQRRVLGGTGGSNDGIPYSWDCMFTSAFEIGINGKDPNGCGGNMSSSALIALYKKETGKNPEADGGASIQDFMNCINENTNTTCTQIGLGGYPADESGVPQHGTVMVGYKADPTSSILHFAKVKNIEVHEVTYSNGQKSTSYYYIIEVNGKEVQVLTSDSSTVAIKFEKKKGTSNSDTNGSF